MCYITIKSDKGFKAKFRRSRSSYTGFCPHPNPFIAEPHTPLLPPTAKFLGGGEEKIAGYFVLADVSKHTSRIPD